jgi:hypothetical protein
VVATIVDPLSIMMYPIPRAWTRHFLAGLSSVIRQDSIHHGELSK